MSYSYGPDHSKSRPFENRTPFEIRTQSTIQNLDVSGFRIPAVELKEIHTWSGLKAENWAGEGENGEGAGVAGKLKKTSQVYNLFQDLCGREAENNKTDDVQPVSRPV